MSVVLTVAAVTATARADVYTDGRLTVDWQRTTDGGYAGTFALDGQSFPATGRASGAAVDGTFTANGTPFAFTGSIAGDTLSLTTGGKAYNLRRAAAATPTNTPTNTPPGYAVTATDDRGLALKVTKVGVRSVQDALSLAVADIGPMFDGKPTTAGAVEDQRDHRSGAAVVTGQRHGKATRGVVSCQLSDAGADVAIVLADADAPAGVWQKLSAPRTAVADAAAKVPLREYQMPDGTGTVGLPDGWSTRATSMLDPMEFDGPGDAKLMVNASLVINTPNCQLVQLWRQTAQMSRQVGMPPPPPPPGLFADFAKPTDAIRTLLPQINQLCRQQNLPTTDGETILNALPAQPQLPNGRAELVEDTAYRVAPDGTRTLMHGIGRLESAVLGPDAWMLIMTTLVARDDQFAKAQPAMAAILNSGTVNQAVCDRISQQRAAQQQQQLAQSAADARARQQAQFEAGQAAHREQMASYDRYNHNWAVTENLKDRSNDNFIEYLRGTRDVEDTRTGQRTTVGLTDAPGIVDDLNRNDPGRFAQIPLRDDMHPLTDGYR